MMEGRGQGAGGSTEARTFLSFCCRWMALCVGMSVISLAPCSMVRASSTAEAAETLVGVAYEPFALPPRVPLAGYSRRKGKPSRGVHDPTGVRALVFDDGVTTAALVSGDLLIVDEHLFDVVRSRLLKEGLPDRLILILAATHTHSGPGAYGTKFLEKVSMGHFDPATFEAIIRATVQATVRAYAARSPARMAYGTAQTDGLVKNRIDSNGFADTELVVSAFYRPDDNRPFAILADFSAHPTTLGAWNWYLSGDYPGVVMRELERRIPGVIALFFAGSVGDQGPVKVGEGFERAEWIGMTLADQAMTALAAAHPSPPERFAALQKRFPLPPARIRLGRFTFPRWLGARLVDDDATLSIVTIGGAVFFGVPCDLSAELGAILKRAASAQSLRPVVVGFASDYVGYCVPAKLYEERQYESSMAFNGPKAGELIVDELIRMMKSAGSG